MEVAGAVLNQVMIRSSRTMDGDGKGSRAPLLFLTFLVPRSENISPSIPNNGQSFLGSHPLLKSMRSKICGQASQGSDRI